MNKTVYLVYKTDSHYTYSSRELIGICSDKVTVIKKIIPAQVIKEGFKLSTEDLFNLDSILQTQGYKGPGEFDFEEVKINVLL